MQRYTAIFCSLFFLNCGATQAINPNPPKESTGPPTTKQTQPTHVSWVEVKDGYQFWSTIKLNDRNVALIGNEYCPPCVVVKSWWEEKIAPPGWQFVYWRLGHSNDLLSQTFKDIFRDLQKSETLKLPYLSIIEDDAADPTKLKAITATFGNLTGCTQDANEFLIMYPQGTRHF
jgi:hypothetical protein